MSLQESLMRDLIHGIGSEVEKMESLSDPISWMEREFYIPETRNDPKLKGRLKLVDYQKDAIREALSKDENGLYKYSIIVWSDIKKSIKSTIAAAVNLWGTEFSEWGERYVVANDLKQADSRVNYYIRRAIQLNPRLAKKYKFNGYRITAPNGSFIEAIPIDPSGEAGSNADQVTFSELWGANESAKQTMWAEMTLSPTKYGRSFRWIESYAGFAGESKLLYSLYELGVTNGRLLWPDRLYDVTEGEPTPLELYVNEEARMLCLWNTQPRCPWQLKAYYKSESSVLLPNQFDRMHRNKWVTNEETFVHPEWIDACIRSQADWPTYDQRRHPMIISLDAGVSGDNFGLWMGCRHPNFPDDVCTVFIQRWIPPTGGKIDFQGTDEKPGPEKVIEKLTKEYNVVQINYDPYQLHDLATRMKKKGITWFKDFPQGPKRLLSDSQFLQLIIGRRFWFRGEPELREHILNANASTDEDDDTKLRLVKKADSKKIDLAVCASMGSYELLRLNLA